MSDTSDDMECASALYESYVEETENYLIRKIWITRSGETIKVKDMTTRHLMNAIQYLRNKSNPDDFTPIYLKLLCEEIKTR